MSKSYARNSKFDAADFSNGVRAVLETRPCTHHVSPICQVVDRVSFDGSDMSNAIFANAVLTGTSFDGANLENTDFSDAFIGDFELRKICA